MKLTQLMAQNLQQYGHTGLYKIDKNGNHKIVKLPKAEKTSVSGNITVSYKLKAMEIYLNHYDRR